MQYFEIMRLCSAVFWYLPLLVLSAGPKPEAGVLRIDGLDEKEYRAWEREMPADSGAAAEWLNDRLESDGYHQCSITVERADNDLRVQAVCGPRSRLAKIELSGNEAFTSEALVFESGLRTGDFFIAGRMREGINRILDLYGEHGYPFCRVFVEGMERTGADIRLRIRVEENGLYFIHAIRIEGNTLTRSKTVMREIDIAPGDTFRQSQIDDAAVKLRKLEWFDAVGEPRLEAFGRRRWVAVVFPVVEGKGVFAEGTLGYQAEDERSPWTGALRIDARNILGTGRKGHLGFQEDIDYRLFELNYTEPWLLGRKLEAGIDLRMEFEREQSSFLNAGLSVRYPLNDEWSVTGKVERREVNEISRGTFSKSWGAGTGFEWNTLDQAWNPTRGLRAGSEVLGYRKQRETNGTSQEWRGKAWAETAFPLRPRLVGYFHLEGSDLKDRAGEALLRSELFRLGGTRTVRGYYENQFAFQGMVWGNMELRIVPEPKSRIFLFLDAGNGFWNDPINGAKRQEFLLGYGAGMRSFTRIGVLGVDVAWGRDVPLRHAKIHAQLRTSL